MALSSFVFRNTQSDYDYIMSVTATAVNTRFLTAILILKRQSLWERLPAAKNRGETPLTRVLHPTNGHN